MIPLLRGALLKSRQGRSLDYFQLRRSYCVIKSDALPVNFYSAQSIAHRLDTLKSIYGTEQDETKTKILAFAWNDVKNIPENEISSLDCESAAKIMQGWHFFAKLWEHGKDGPGETQLEGAHLADNMKEYEAFLHTNEIAAVHHVEVKPKKSRLQRRN